MSYFRVIPRDLFNEGNLLKCLGRLYLNLEIANYPFIGLEHDGQAFQIEQSDEDGSLCAVNVRLRIYDRLYLLRRPLNSREPWPLYLSDPDREIAVFNQDGRFADEMVNFLESGTGIPKNFSAKEQR